MLASISSVAHLPQRAWTSFCQTVEHHESFFVQDANASRFQKIRHPVQEALKCVGHVFTYVANGLFSGIGYVASHAWALLPKQKKVESKAGTELQPIGAATAPENVAKKTATVGQS